MRIYHIFRRIYVIFLVVSLFSSAFSHKISNSYLFWRPLILEYPSEIEKKAADEAEVNWHCTSWSSAAETNNLVPWKTISVECADCVKDYVIGKGYITDLESLSEEASIFASSVEFAGDDKDLTGRQTIHMPMIIVVCCIPNTFVGELVDTDRYLEFDFDRCRATPKMMPRVTRFLNLSTYPNLLEQTPLVLEISMSKQKLSTRPATP